MKIFQKYANYYNLLYRDKDYPGEVEFVNSLLQKYRPSNLAGKRQGIQQAGQPLPEELRALQSPRLSKPFPIV